jgi:hypothetical protein
MHDGLTYGLAAIFISIVHGYEVGKLEDEGMGPGCAVFVCVKLNSKMGTTGIQRNCKFSYYCNALFYFTIWSFLYTVKTQLLIR